LLSACFTANSEVPVSSATLFRWADYPHERDAHLVIVVAELPGRQPLQELDRSFGDLAPIAVGVTWMSLNTARLRLRQVGDPLTELAETGAHAAGLPLGRLVADPAPYDPNHVRLAALETSLRWATRLEERRAARSTGSYLALVLEGYADLALMHHRLGRLATVAEGNPTVLGERRLGRLIGTAEASAVVQTILALRTQGDEDCSRTFVAAGPLVDSLRAAAANSAAPGCTIG
jgi:hypothetical protein